MCVCYVCRSIKKVTVILPFHNEKENICAVVNDIIATLQEVGIEPHIFLVDDGSTDESMSIVRNICKIHKSISYISFSRNFGKETAIMAGISECGDNFDVLAYMDSDGQHSARDLLRLLEAAEDPGLDLICGVRRDRSYQSYAQKIMAKAFYAIFRKFSGSFIDEGVGDFNVMTPKVVKAMRQLNEEHPFMKGLIGWIGFRKHLVPIDIATRKAGVAKSSTKKMFKLAFGAILSFSSLPLKFWSLLGFVFATISILYLLFVIFQTIAYGRHVPGYASTVVLILWFGGLQLISIGILGEYISRIYDSAKKRPRYIVAERFHSN